MASDHERTDFRCGEPALDSFLVDEAVTYVRRGMCRVFVLTARAEKQVLGFYASAATSVQQRLYPNELPLGLPSFPYPAIHLGRLAVREERQGRGLGKLLLGHFFTSVLQIAELTGVNMVDVVAKSERVKAMYRKIGFEELKKNPLHLFLSLDTIRGTTEPRG